jgi:putative Flp pilus-assembly TadE/G-like protein
VIVVFSLAIALFMGLCAIAVDISWYWVSSLRIQRAADAAALAGVVHLPQDPGRAIAIARAEATKNGYTSGLEGFTVTPTPDPANPRRLKVSISGPVPTYFANVFGFDAFPAFRDSKAEYILPVPMGSPQNYFGVGFFEGRGPGVDDTPRRPPTATVPPDTWIDPDNVFGDTDGDDAYATIDNATDLQIYRDFGLNIPAGRTIFGIEIQVEARSSDNSGCRIAVELWNTASSSWTTEQTDDLDDDDDTDFIGDSTDLWGRSWTTDDFSDGNFRLRVRGDDPGAVCDPNSTTFLDRIRVRVYFQGFGSNTVFPVPDPESGDPLPPQNFWGAVFTSGGVRENGDRYAPAFLGGGAPEQGSKGSANPVYDPDGYDYTVEFKPGASGGRVYLFDPLFCATGDNGRGGSYGAGDHWTDHPPNQVIRPVHVNYRLYNMSNTPYDEGDDALLSTLTYDPGSATLGDFSGTFGTPQNSGDANRQDCSGHAAHNQWVLLDSGLAAGMYRVNVNTTLAGANMNVGAENGFSIWVGANGPAGLARVYGGGRMAAYTNQDTTVADFYLAQIEDVHAGKTMTINLFDPGESSGNAFLRIRSPINGSSYTYATFNWQSDDGRSGSNVSEIQTSIGGSAQFNNRSITISIPLPSNYGATDLTPAGETEPGWWKIEYETNQSNDTTTWEVGIGGNPVHLVLN